MMMFFLHDIDSSKIYFGKRDSLRMSLRNSSEDEAKDYATALQHIDYAISQRFLRLYIRRLDNLLCLPEDIMHEVWLRELYASHNPRMYAMPYNIGRLHATLHIMDLTHGGLEALPESLCCLNHLRVLHLSNNKLRCLPWSIGALTSLEDLALDNNLLRVVPPSMTVLLGGRVKNLVLGPNPYLPITASEDDVVRELCHTATPDKVDKCVVCGGAFPLTGPIPYMRYAKETTPKFLPILYPICHAECAVHIFKGSAFSPV